jgi:23S rRNA pseudouridine1911/1915/1917 synthase
VEIKRWHISEKEAGMRLDVFLTQAVEGLSRSGAARALQNQEVQHLGKKNMKPGSVLHSGDEIVYTPAPPVSADAKPEALPLTVVYQDDAIAVINKPAGLVTHPAVGHHAGTLVNALLYHLNNLSGVGGVLRPGIVHRLDKETSGLMLVAKNDRAHQILAERIQKRDVERLYDAVVWGAVQDSSFVVDTQLGRDTLDRKRFAVVRSGGKRAITHIEVVRRFQEFSLLRVKLETGRTHQIRIHCNYVGTPVVGDRTYGRRSESNRMKKLELERPPRQLLHAQQLRFCHPITEKRLEFTAPWPDDFKDFVSTLKPS